MTLETSLVLSNLGAILRRGVFATVAVCAVIFVREVDANASDTVSKEQVLEHLDAMFSNQDEIVFKWRSPVTVYINALSHEDLQQTDIDAVLSVLDMMSVITGLEFVSGEIEEGQEPPNLMFFFTPSPVERLQLGVAAQLFNDTGLARDLYVRELNEWWESIDPNDSWVRKMVVGYNDDRAGYAAVVVNTKSIGANDIRKYLLQMIFTMLLKSDSSDVIHPSWANSGDVIDKWYGSISPSIPKIDVAILQAIYRHPLAHGTPYINVRKALATSVTKELTVQRWLSPDTCRSGARIV